MAAAGWAVARRLAQVSNGQRRRAGVAVCPPRALGEPSPQPPCGRVCQAACGAGLSLRAGLELGVGGVAAPRAGSCAAAFPQLSPSVRCVPPTALLGLPRGSRRRNAILSGTGGESGTGPSPPGLQASGQRGTVFYITGPCLCSHPERCPALGARRARWEQALGVSHRWLVSGGAPWSAVQVSVGMGGQVWG